MDRQKIRNLVICWCIHRLVGCLHLEKCFIRRHIPFCGRFHTGLFYEKKLSVIQANFSVEPPMSSHPLNTLKTLLALSTALFVLWDHCFGLPESAFRQCTIFRRELIKTVALPGGGSSWVRLCWPVWVLRTVTSLLWAGKHVRAGMHVKNSLTHSVVSRKFHESVRTG